MLERDRDGKATVAQRSTATSVEVAILFADVCGSTQLYETIGDRAAQAVIQSCLGFMSNIVERAGGAVVRTIGDEIMASFDDAEAAINAACAIQSENEQGSKRFEGERLWLRTGVHFGTALREQAEDAIEFYGSAVTVASRVADIAKATQVITTSETADLLPPELQQRVRPFHRIRIDGGDQRFVICEVVWDQDAASRGETLAPDQPPLGLALRYGNRQLQLAAESGGDGCLLGRAAHCDLLIAEPLASRVHARIIFRRGKFVLVDESTNGTFVRTSDGQEVYLLKEELILWGGGHVALARSVADSPERIAFTCM